MDSEVILRIIMEGVDSFKGGWDITNTITGTVILGIIFSLMKIIAGSLKSAPSNIPLNGQWGKYNTATEYKPKSNNIYGEGFVIKRN